MVTALQTMVTRAFDVFDPVVVTVGSFHAGHRRNIIPDEALFDATVRAVLRRAADAGPGRPCAVVARASRPRTGWRSDADYERELPGHGQRPDRGRLRGPTVREVFGEDRFTATAPQPFTGSEDFSFVLDEVPGAFVAARRLPAGPDPATAAYNHSPEALFDDAVLPDGAALYAELAMRRLERVAV